eukprot:3621346-Rhodomonas_salina.2
MVLRTATPPTARALQLLELDMMILQCQINHILSTLANCTETAGSGLGFRQVRSRGDVPTLKSCAR